MTRGFRRAGEDGQMSGAQPEVEADNIGEGHMSERRAPWSLSNANVSDYCSRSADHGPIVGTRANSFDSREARWREEEKRMQLAEKASTILIPFEC